MYSFHNFEQQVVPCPVLTVASWAAYRFLRRQVRCSFPPISLRLFHSLLWSTVKGFLVFNEAEVDVFFWNFLASLWSRECSNWISGSSAISKPSLFICKFSVHALLKPSLKDFEHHFTSMDGYINSYLFFLQIICLWLLYLY